MYTRQWRDDGVSRLERDLRELYVRLQAACYLSDPCCPVNDSSYGEASPESKALLEALNALAMLLSDLDRQRASGGVGSLRLLM